MVEEVSETIERVMTKQPIVEVVEMEDHQLIELVEVSQNVIEEE